MDGIVRVGSCHRFWKPEPVGFTDTGNADTDIRQNFQAAVSWTLPQARGRGLVHNALSGWGIDGRFFVRSAYPVTVLGNLCTTL